MFCSVADCGRKIYAKGLCPMHYRRPRRNGHTDRVVGPGRKACAVEDCNRPVDARGLCHGHYQRVLRRGDVNADEALARDKNPGTCIVEGCNRPQRTKKMCKAHYSRLLRFGETRPHTPIKQRTGEGSISHGYRKVPVPQDLRHLTNGQTQVPEHRLVMAMRLGRPLFPDESVHHKNGNRLDNRIENLELWSRWQPSGQRIEDQLAWAIDFVQRYRPDVLNGVTVREALTNSRVPPIGFEPTSQG